MKKILVIGASGFVGGAVAKALLADGHAVRCLARTPAKVADLAALGCEAMRGDMSDPASLQAAVTGVEAVYISIQTISSQPASPAGQGFMDVEMIGIQNIAAACKAHGVRRVIYVTSLGIERDAPSVWLRERWKIEQALVTDSGLDATVIRPGMIVGAGGRGFGMAVAQAKSRVAIVMGNGRGRMRDIALGDLVYYLAGVLDEPRAYGQCYDVGGDDLPTSDQRIDAIAGILGRKPPAKLHIPLGLVAAVSSLIGAITKSPKGALKGILAALKLDGIADPRPIRTILPRPPLSFRQAVETALHTQHKE